MSLNWSKHSYYLNTQRQMDASDDVVRQNWGSSWHIPSFGDFMELKNNCSKTTTYVDGKRGTLMTSNINGNTLFFPFGGLKLGSSLTDDNDYGEYWCNTNLGNYMGGGYLSGKSVEFIWWNANGSPSEDGNYYAAYGLNIKPIFG